jgi:hypothetical protein
MKAHGHIKIFSVVTAAWAIFWLIGWPEYYRQYSFRFMLFFDTAVFVLLWFVVYWVLKTVPRKYRTSFSLWLAFYITIPLFLYDFLYCGVYLSYGFSFIWEFWFLSVYYVIPWIICPVTAIWLNRRDSQSTTTRIRLD